MNIKVYFRESPKHKLRFLYTGFNGTLEEAKRYYVGRIFNLGNSDKDLMALGVEVVELY